ncbi:4'-phosphopantetheinyl transferase superfamily protein [Clostridium bornimense]|uniref:4'-phosphopantetheinyl transferase family protein n=1 Tax=Clostridium bornimense TaxID=1216932 RepID=UPI001C0FC97A|nr:4'-phosphopantetheinyl transferase superfamily protein [Clostridium bornimense]MBU5316398.1 4'-phosphopantetheinyl transferase superfamily protein [Clostridium bornimense]
MVITTFLNKISISEKMKFEGVSLLLLQASKVSVKEKMATHLSAKEKIYYDRLFRSKKRQEEMYLGRLAAKSLVIEHTGYKGQLKDIELIKIKDREKPKLFINNVRINNDISIAHNNMYAVAVFSHKDKVGVDIEKCSLKLDKSFIRYAFSKEEIEFWKTYETEYENIWVLLWTIKEAIGKALDFGLSFGMNFIKILMDKEEERKLLIVFKKEDIIEKLIYGRNMELSYSVKNDNYISICRLWKV